MPIGSGPGVIGRKPSVQKPREHDGLCITTTAEYGMQFCWCVRPCCWHPEGARREKRRGSSDPDAVSYREPLPPRLKGRCICRDCPCHDPIHLLPTSTAAASSEDPPSRRQRSVHAKGGRP